MSSDVPPVENVLGSVRTLRIPAQHALHLVTEFGIAQNRSRDLMSKNEQSTGYLAANTSHGTEKIVRRITEFISRSTADCALSIAQTVRALAALADEYLELTQRAERVVQDCRDTLVKIQNSVSELRSISGLSGEPLPGYWKEEVPLHNPTTFREETPRAMDSLLSAGTISRSAQDDRWYWLAVTHNSLLNEVREQQREWKTVERQRVELETATAAAIERAATDLSHARRRLPHRVDVQNRAPLEIAAFNAHASTEKWGNLTPSGQRARNWAQKYSFEIAGSYEFAPEIQQIAATHSLELALQYPERAYFAMGFAGTGLTLQRFIDQTQHLKRTLNTARSQHPGQPYQLLTFGRHNDSLTAVVSVGDMNTADRVTVVVPGMFSHVGNVDTLIAGATNIQHAAQQRTRADARASGTNTATIAFMGYDSPGLLQETRSRQAWLGGHELSRFLGALTAQSETARPTWVGTASHSYGSFTTGEALKVLDRPIQSFASVGSAGLAANTQREDLATEQISAISADPPPVAIGPMPRPTVLAALTAYLTYDAVAPIGQLIGRHSVDPRTLPGATTILNAGTGTRVTTHAIWTPVDAHSHGYLSAGTPSVEAIARMQAGAQPSTSTGQFRKIEVP